MIGATIPGRGERPMSKDRDISIKKLAGGALLGAMSAGLAAAAMSGAGTADATCASISGIGNGNGCTSTPTSFAIGIGANTTANAQGLFDSAISNGFTNTGAQFTQSLAIGNFDTAI